MEEFNKPYVEGYLRKTALKHTRYFTVYFVCSQIEDDVVEIISNLQDMYMYGFNHEFKTGKTSMYPEEICVKRKGFRTIPIYYDYIFYEDLINQLLGHIHCKHEIRHIVNSLSLAV